MDLTITDPNILARLLAVQHVLDIRGPNGEIIGTFQPPRGVPPAGFKIPFTPEEVERRRQEKTGRPLAEVLRDLNAKYPEGRRS